MASTTVGNLGELIENILEHLDDIKPLTIAQRVNRLWYLTANSKRLRRPRFLEPAKKIECWEVNDLPSYPEVPILNITEQTANVFEAACRTRQVAIVRINPLCIDEIVHPRSLSLAYRLRRRSFGLQINLFGLKPGEKDSRWDMFITQPPTAAASYDGSCTIYLEGLHGPQTFSFTVWICCGIRRPAGIKFGDIVEEALRDAAEEGLDIEGFTCDLKLKIGLKGAVAGVLPSERRLVHDMFEAANVKKQQEASVVE
jgi:hypothetical protein